MKGSVDTVRATLVTVVAKPHEHNQTRSLMYFFSASNLSRCKQKGNPVFLAISIPFQLQKSNYKQHFHKVVIKSLTPVPCNNNET